MPAWIVSFFRLTRREYFADFFITPPLTLVFAIYSLRHGFGALWIPEAALGWCAWTFYEYAVHRWALHGLPLFSDVHALHHRNQKDYIALPPWATLAVYAAFWMVFGIGSSAVIIGFSVGYIVYSALHTAFHYAAIAPAGWLARGDRRHHLHHRFDSVCFGVTTGFWDRLFGTEDLTS